MKPIVQKLWIVMAMLCLSLNASAYDFEVDGIYYSITSMSNLEVEVTYKNIDVEIYSTWNQNYVKSCVNNSYNGIIEIPCTVNYNNRTYTVTRIGEEAFGVKPSNYGYDGSPNSPTSFRGSNLNNS